MLPEGSPAAEAAEIVITVSGPAGCGRAEVAQAVAAMLLRRAPGVAVHVEQGGVPGRVHTGADTELLRVAARQVLVRVVPGGGA